MTNTNNALSVAQFRENSELCATEFLDTVKHKCTKDPNGYLITHAAQDYIEGLLKRLPKNDRPSVLVSFAEVVAHRLTGEAHRQARCYSSVVASLPASDDVSLKARHALDKVGKSNGLIVPPGWERNL